MGEYLYFLVCWCLWRLRFARRSLPADPRAILVVRLDHLGDGILSAPVIENLRRHYPSARIDLLCARWNRPAFTTNPHIARIMEFNPRTFRRVGERYDRAGRCWQALSALKGEYQIVVTLRGTWLTLMLVGGYWLDRGAVRIESRLRRRPMPRHEADISLSLLEFAGIPVSHRTPEYAVPDEARSDATELLHRAQVPHGRPLVACHVGSPVFSKRWPPTRFATLVEGLADEGAHVLLVGGIWDEPIIDEVVEISHAGATSLAGRATVPQLAAVLERCACFVGNDSAPMHLAAATGIPTLGLFFSSDPHRFGPRGQQARSLKARDARGLPVEDVLDVLGSFLRSQQT